MSSTGLTKRKVQTLLGNLESEKIERTAAVNDTDKFTQAICALLKRLGILKRAGSKKFDFWIVKR